MGPVCNQAGIFPRVRDMSPLDYNPPPYSHQSTKGPSVRGSDNRTVDAKDNRTGPKSGHSRVLQQVFPGTKAFREVERYLRPVKPKSAPVQMPVQDGNGREHQVPAGKQVLGDIAGSKTCILSRQGPQESQKIPEIRDSGPSLPVSGTADGITVLSMGVHEGDQAHNSLCTSEGNTTQSVFGRLAHKSPTDGDSSQTHSDNTKDHSEPRVLGESGKIRVSSQTEVRLSRDGPRFETSDSGGNAKQVRSSPEEVTESVGESCNSQTLGKANSDVSLNVLSNGVGYMSGTPITVVSKENLAPEVHAQKLPNTNQSKDSATFIVVGSDTECDKPDSPASAECQNISLHGRIDGGLGCSAAVGSKDSGVVGSMVRVRKAPSHQRPRVTGSQTSLETGFKVVSEQSGHGGHGQHQCGGLLEQTGGSEVQGTVFQNTPPSGLGKEVSHCDKSTTHSRAIKRHRRHAVAEASDPADGVVFTPGSVQDDMRKVRHPEHRPVCDSTECEITGVCISDAGPTGVRGGCASSQLEGPQRLCIPANSSSDTGTAESPTRAMSDDFGRPLLAGTNVVPGTKRAGKRKSNTVTSGSVAHQSADDKSVSRQPTTPKFTRLGLIKAKLSEKYHDTVADVMADPHRQSTSSVYDSKWHNYVEWCIIKNIKTPTQSTEDNVAEFLVSLKGFAYSTIKGYLTAISKVVCLYTGVDLARSKALCDLIIALTKDLVIVDKTPEWDLSLVLSALKQAPFEPMESCEISYLTYKAVFLVTLAAGGRRSEIHALTTDRLTHGPSYEWVIIYPCVTFKRKNQKVSDGISGINPVHIKALPREGGEDALLCPVRALQLYLDRVAPHRKGRKNVFLPIKPGIDRVLNVHTLSSWLKKCISIAYELAGKSEKKATGHEVRKYAVSWAYHNNVSVSNLLKVCRWKSQSSFTDYYLKDCLGVVDGMFTVGPVVVAGHTVNPS